MYGWCLKYGAYNKVIYKQFCRYYQIDIVEWAQEFIALGSMITIDPCIYLQGQTVFDNGQDHADETEQSQKEEPMQSKSNSSYSEPGHNLPNVEQTNVLPNANEPHDPSPTTMQPTSEPCYA